MSSADDTQACCACLTVKYDPIHNQNGTMSERWRCSACGARFTRQGARPMTTPLQALAANVRALVETYSCALEHPDFVPWADLRLKYSRIASLLDQLAERPLTGIVAAMQDADEDRLKRLRWAVGVAGDTDHPRREEAIVLLENAVGRFLAAERERGGERYRVEGFHVLRGDSIVSWHPDGGADAEAARLNREAGGGDGARQIGPLETFLGRPVNEWVEATYWIAARDTCDGSPISDRLDRILARERARAEQAEARVKELEQSRVVPATSEDGLQRVWDAMTEWQEKAKQAEARAEQLEAERDGLKAMCLRWRDRCASETEENVEHTRELARLRSSLATAEGELERVRGIADRCRSWTTPEVLGTRFAQGRMAAFRDCAAWIDEAAPRAEPVRDAEELPEGQTDWCWSGWVEGDCPPPPEAAQTSAGIYTSHSGPAPRPQQEAREEAWRAMREALDYTCNFDWPTEYAHAIDKLRAALALARNVEGRDGR